MSAHKLDDFFRPISFGLH